MKMYEIQKEENALRIRRKKTHSESEGRKRTQKLRN